MVRAVKKPEGKPMMEGNPPKGLRRWAVFGSGLVGSLAPTILLTFSFAPAGFFVPVFLSFWVEILFGPVKYWLPILLEHPSKYAIHPMSGVTIWVYLACFLLMLAHPVKPRLLTALMTSIGFCVWYGWAFLAIAAVEY
jgi:hypothetical protein